MEIDYTWSTRFCIWRWCVFFWISHFHQIIHLSHQRLLSAPESVTATSIVRESSAWTSLKTTGVLLWLFQRFCCQFVLFWQTATCGSSGWKHSHSVFDQQSRTWQDSQTVDQAIGHIIHIICMQCEGAEGLFPLCCRSL